MARSGLAELGGTSWRFDGAAGADIEFDGDGSLSGSAGVNRFRGTYALDGDILRVGPLATMRPCATTFRWISGRIARLTTERHASLVNSPRSAWRARPVAASSGIGQEAPTASAGS